MSRICFIAQFPPPIHGLSKAVDTLYNAPLAEEVEFEKVNITDNRAILRNLLAICRSRADLFYFTISQTRGGNLRDLIILKLLRLRRKRCLIHLHGGNYRQMVENDLPAWQRKANHRAMAALAGAIVLGPSLKFNFEGMVPEARIFTVPNCVDDEYLMSDGEFAEKLRTLPERGVKHVLYLSNFIKSKGYPAVLEMAKLEKRRVDAGGERAFHFDFAGKFFEASEEADFKSFVKDNGLEDYVTYHGVVGGEEKRALLKRGDVFILLTRYPKEGQPISILEAMGNGMAIATTDHAGIPDIVPENNFVFRDVDAQDVLARIAVSEETARTNRAAVLNGYTETRYIQNMRSVFKEFV
ncbi:MAG: glycosyltransferase family 4 protein [Clostridia bacterium]|nr:glycosyltransferase family 4 protein [Clostridia bacterium]